MQSAPISQHLDFGEVIEGDRDWPVDGMPDCLGVNAVLQAQTRKDRRRFRIHLQRRSSLLGIQEYFSQATVIKMARGRAVAV
jgi:hypothetical protein